MVKTAETLGGEKFPGEKVHCHLPSGVLITIIIDLILLERDTDN